MLGNTFHIYYHYSSNCNHEKSRDNKIIIALLKLLMDYCSWSPIYKYISEKQTYCESWQLSIHL